VHYRIAHCLEFNAKNNKLRNEKIDLTTDFLIDEEAETKERHTKSQGATFITKNKSKQTDSYLQEFICLTESYILQ